MTQFSYYIEHSTVWNSDFTLVAWSQKVKDDSIKTVKLTFILGKVCDCVIKGAKLKRIEYGQNITAFLCHYRIKRREV